MFLRVVVLTLSLGLTLVSFQSYRQRQTDRLRSAFVGFAFLSIGVGLTVLRTEAGSLKLPLQIAETVPFIVGFGMLYRSLYQ